MPTHHHQQRRLHHHIERRATTELHGQVALVLTSPPRGLTMRGGPPRRRSQACSRGTGGGPTNQIAPSRAGRVGLFNGLAGVLTACVPLLKPGGVVIVTTRGERRDALRTKSPALIGPAGIAAGLQPLDRCVALLTAIDSGQLVDPPRVKGARS